MERFRKDIWHKFLNEGWLSERFNITLKNVNDISFWNKVWVGSEILRNRFNRLYQLSLAKEAIVADMDFWRSG